MTSNLIEWVAGLCLAWITLRDVFGTVVVPGSSRGSLRLARRLMLGMLPAWHRFKGPGVGVGYAPLMLLLAFVGWMLLLVLAFGLMAHAARASFSPPLDSFGEALAVAGGAMTTIGFGKLEMRGSAAAVTVGAGFCGLAVMTMAVTYLLEMQSNIGHRDTGVLKLTVSSGIPPSAVALLERHAALDAREELLDVLRSARDWCATVLQSHASHPSLIYFRSAGTESGWPATLGTLVDLALVIELLLDEPRVRGAAVLLREQAMRLALALTELLQLEPAAITTPEADALLLLERLRAAGYRVCDAPDLARFAQARRQHVGPVEALSHHLGTPGAPLLPE